MTKPRSGSAGGSVQYCKKKIRDGRFAGFSCGRVVPCEEHDIRPLALHMQALGPDEFPYGFYVGLAKSRFNLRETPVKSKKGLLR